MLSAEAQRELIAHYVLDDYTDWPVYMSRLWRNSKVWVDHVAWSVINVILLFFLWATAVLQWFDLPMRWVSQKLYARYKRPCVGPRQSDKQVEGHIHNDQKMHTLSAVNAETPDIHHAYLADDEKETSTTSKVAGTNLAKREFDLDNALLFIHLCALVYEDEVVLEYVLRQWHLEYRVILSPDKECISQAWVIFHSSSTCSKGDHQHACPRAGQDFIIVVFKGTSPFNFTEWMTDMTMSKVKPHGENLPGMVHGYAFGTPRTGDARHAKEIGRHPKAKHFYRVINANDIVCTVPLCGHAKTQDPRALTNFWHIGTPVLVNYWGTFEVGTSWSWSHVVRNALLHYAQLLLPVPFVVHVLRSRAKLLTLARAWNLHLCCFLVDHFPSGYIKHLHACKARQEGQAWAWL